MKNFFSFAALCVVLCCTGGGAVTFLGDRGVRQQKLTKKAPAPSVSTPLPYKNWLGKNILYVYAHIDDMEGTSAGMTSDLTYFAEVYLLILTNGDKGCGNPVLCGNSTNAEVAAARQKEQLDSAAILNIPSANIFFLSYEDCLLPTYPVQIVQQEIVAIIRRIQPDVVITWDPTPNLNLIPSQGWDDMGYHPDHQWSGKLALDSVWLAELGRTWPHLGTAWRVPEVYFWAFDPTRQPDYYVDVTGNAFEMKTIAFLSMHTQYTDEKEVTDFLDFVGSQVAQTVGLPAGSKAEGFNYALW